MIKARHHLAGFATSLLRTIRVYIVLATLVMIPAATDAEAPVPLERIERRVQAMGTDLGVIVEAPSREQALAASERAIRAVIAAEERLSTWNPSSELSRLNDAPSGDSVRVSPELFNDLQSARAWSEATSGAFSLGSGELVRAWGLRSGGRRPADDELDAMLPGIARSNLVIEDGRVARLDDVFVIEEGAFGKGAGLDDAVAVLERGDATGAVLDLGGQVTVWGDAVATVGIADPRDRRRVVLQLLLTSGSTATSGNSERGIIVDGQRLGHILDPRTGRPSPEFGSVTVWSESSLAADCLSTGLYVLGARDASQWASGRDDVAVVILEVIDRKLVAHVSATLRDRIRAAADDVAFQWI